MQARTGKLAGILVARHPKTDDDLFDTKVSPENRVAGRRPRAVSERIMGKIDNVFSGRGGIFRKSSLTRSRLPIPLETHIDLLSSRLSRRLDSGLLRGECVGMKE
jgi:hypothetical protein